MFNLSPGARTSLRHIVAQGNQFHRVSQARRRAARYTDRRNSQIQTDK